MYRTIYRSYTHVVFLFGDKYFLCRLLHTTLLIYRTMYFMKHTSEQVSNSKVHAWKKNRVSTFGVNEKVYIRLSIKEKHSYYPFTLEIILLLNVFCICI